MIVFLAQRAFQLPIEWQCHLDTVIVKHHTMMMGLLLLVSNAIIVAGTARAEVTTITVLNVNTVPI